MAFNCASGRHRRPGRTSRTTAGLAGLAALTTTGVVGTLATPAAAAEPAAETSGLLPVVTIGDRIAEQIDEQAEAQERAAAEAAASAKALKEREEAEARAARKAERDRLRRLTMFVSPIAGSYVSTGYQAGGAVWSSGSHTGVDFHAAAGTPVRSVGRGTVVEAGWGGSYGYQVVIKMHDGTYTQYGHLSSVGVAAGQSVTAGEHIGRSGATGNVTGPHLHFEARTTSEYGSDIDPVAYLRSHGVNL
ncbi:M23 family metallopeptidase [Streptomyces abyssomicinicus]|uniref:M23 family metallopeptidase n=1 Tax=Streptomyces abyssomicinicus TaxID=574929 RepID=UPI00124FA012|nr:M23 family metallopeptidase [Streptomyces abyssomicinicus]